MTQVSFDAKSWAEALAQSLPVVLEEQDRLIDPLGLFVPHLIEATISHETFATKNIPSDSPVLLYYAALSSTEHEQEREFEGLRSAVTNSIKILVNHPALSHVVDITHAEENFVVILPEHAIDVTVLHILDGLTSRGKEIQPDGFMIACRELCELLGTSESETTSGLKLGYHASLFHGLRYDQEFPIDGAMRIVPFDRIRHYVGEAPLQPFSLSSKVPNPWNGVSAIVKPFEWQPKFRSSSNEPICLNTGWQESFREDSAKFCELLAISHAAPVVYLTTVFYRVHPVASQLLGQRERPTSYISDPYAQSFDRTSNSSDFSVDATEETISLFKERNGKYFRELEAIFPRLATAVTRKGRFALEDQILDVAMALERLYRLDRGEISYKLKTRAACYLEPTTEARNRVFNEVKKFYDLRSAIVHGSGRKRGTNKEQESAFIAGFEIARRTLFKHLREGSPSNADWNQIVIAATDASQ